MTETRQFTNVFSNCELSFPITDDSLCCFQQKPSGILPQMNTVRNNIRPGMNVEIVLKQDQKSGKLTSGIVKDLLTNSPNHHHGIKVRLISGEVGRVKNIISTSK